MASIKEFMRKFTGTDEEEQVVDEQNYFDDISSMQRRRHDSDPSNYDREVSVPVTTQLKIVVFKPQKYEDGCEIIDYFKLRKAIVLNLDSTNKATTCRLLDFFAGATYATGGKFKRIGNAMYMLTPYDVDISGEIIEDLESAATTDMY
ncbi:MAG: cell division protein SepF [Oscillospiraceae bacterium]|nr:cell division protein SepF [Oscillospiraceae bacterium]